MVKLNLPIIRGAVTEAKQLSMDDYLKFVNLYLKYTFNRRINDRWEKMSKVNVPFFIKEKNRKRVKNDYNT